MTAFVVPDQWSLGWQFSEGLAAGSISNKYGFIDKSGKPVIQPRFEWAEDFSEGLAAVSIGQKWGFINRSGDVVIEPGFDRVGPFRDGMARVQRGETWLFLDKKGKTVIAGKKEGGHAETFNGAEDFSGGLGRVHIGGTLADIHDAPRFWTGGVWYYVNREGKIVRRCRGDEEGGKSGQAIP
jgi:hypothetical protein